MTFSPSLFARSALLIGIGAASPALAQAPGPASGFTPGQNTAIVTPKLPQAAPAPVVALPPSTPAPSAGEAGNVTLLPALKGLVFVAGAQALKAQGLADTGAGVSAPQLPILNDPQFQAQMKAHLGQPLRTMDMQQVRDQTKAWYVAHQHPFVDIVVPPQNISSGVVQVVVSEYRLGEVTVTGARYFSSSLVEKPLDLKAGETIALPRLQTNIDRLNENPFLSVDAQFQPGAAPGTTDLVLRAKDRLPVRVYAGYDNQGVPTLDEREWNAGVNWGNVFGTGQIASYQFTRAFNGRFQSHSVSDVITLDHADKLLVFGNYAQLRSTADFGLFRLDSIGHSAQASVRWVRTLPRWEGLTGHLQLGYDYKFTDTDAQFNEIRLGPPSAMETHQFPFIYDGAEVDRLGSTSLENDLIYAPGRWSARDSDAAFQALVAGSKAEYVYDRVSVTRTTRLPADLSIVARAILQRSSAILPNSEQLGGGGVGSVRGYFPDTALGSNGELGSLELRSPAFSPSSVLGRAVGDQAQVGVFYDYASLRQPYYPKLTFPSAGNGTMPQDLASAGVLAHYAVGRFVDLNFDMGWQLRKTADEARLGNFAAVAVVFSN